MSSRPRGWPPLFAIGATVGIGIFVVALPLPETYAIAAIMLPIYWAIAYRQDYAHRSPRHWHHWHTFSYMSSPMGFSDISDKECCICHDFKTVFQA